MKYANHKRCHEPKVQVTDHNILSYNKCYIISNAETQPPVTVSRKMMRLVIEPLEMTIC